jgi:hypothetical protein
LSQSAPLHSTADYAGLARRKSANASEVDPRPPALRGSGAKAAHCYPVSTTVASRARSPSVRARINLHNVTPGPVRPGHNDDVAAGPEPVNTRRRVGLNSSQAS